MLKRSVWGVVAIACLVAPEVAHAQFGGLKIPGLDRLMPGAGAASAGASLGAFNQPGTPMGQVNTATLRFLKGGKELADAVNDAKLAGSYQVVIDKVEASGVDQKTGAEVSDLGEKTSALIKDKAKLERAQVELVEQAGVDVGTGAYLESFAVASARSILTHPPTNPTDISSAALFAQTVPTNLTAMLNVQRALYGFLKSKGRDPDSAAKSAAQSLQKG